MDRQPHRTEEAVSHQARPWLLGLVCAWVLFHLLCYTDVVPLFHEEPRRAIVAQEMLLSGDYAVPTMYRVPYLKKPPAQSWLIAWASRPAGTVTSFSARAVSVAALAATALSLYVFLRRRRRELALPAAFIAGTNFLMLFEYGNKVEPDLLVTAFTTLSYLVYISGPLKPLPLVVSSVFMGAGILTKGLSPLYFYPPLLLYALLTREHRGRRVGMLGLHAVLSLALPVAWLWRYHLHGDLDLLMGVFSREVASRTSSGVLDFVRHLVHFPLRLFAVLAPWSAALLLARKPAQERDALYWTSLYGFLFALVLFTVIPNARSRYVMPAIPFFAMAAAYHFDGQRTVGPRVRLTVFILLGLGAVGFALKMLLENMWAQGAILLALAVVAAALQRLRYSVLWLTVTVAVLSQAIYVHSHYFMRSVDPFDYPRFAANMLVEMNRPLPIVVNEAQNPKHIAFYLESLGRRLVYAESLGAFEHYYYVSIPEGYDPDDGWVLTEVGAKANP